MNDLSWKHIATIIASFIAGYALTQVAQGYDTVAIHWSWQAILTGMSMSGLYTGGLVQNPPNKP